MAPGCTSTEPVIVPVPPRVAPVLTVTGAGTATDAAPATTTLKTNAAPASVVPGPAATAADAAASRIRGDPVSAVRAKVSRPAIGSGTKTAPTRAAPAAADAAAVAAHSTPAPGSRTIPWTPASSAGGSIADERDVAEGDAGEVGDEDRSAQTRSPPASGCGSDSSTVPPAAFVSWIVRF